MVLYDISGSMCSLTPERLAELEAEVVFDFVPNNDGPFPTPESWKRANENFLIADEPIE